MGEKIYDQREDIYNSYPPPGLDRREPAHNRAHEALRGHRGVVASMAPEQRRAMSTMDAGENVGRVRDRFVVLMSSGCVEGEAILAFLRMKGVDPVHINPDLHPGAGLFLEASGVQAPVLYRNGDKIGGWDQMQAFFEPNRR